jgi:ketosteroid isomerase-like protein
MRVLKPKRKSLFLNGALILSAMLIAASCVTKPAAPSPEEAEMAVMAKERQSLDNWSAGNAIGYAVNAADDITYLDDIGASTRLDGKEECDKYLTSLAGMISPHNYEMVDPKVQVYGNVAILTFHYQPSDSTGQPGMPWKATTVYNFRDGDWYMVHANWSLVKNQ